MNNLPKNISLIILIGLLSLIIMGIIFWRIFGVSNNPKTLPLPSPSVQPTTTASPFLNQINTSSFSKTQISKTTDSEVKQIASIQQSSSNSGRVQYVYPSFYKSRSNLIQTSNGVAIFERTITITKDLIHPDLTKYLNELGKADKEVRGSKYYGQFFKTYIFASKGVTIIANPLQKRFMRCKGMSQLQLQTTLINGGMIYP